MKAMMISIRKPFTDMIFRLDDYYNDYDKTNEWRKKPLPIGHYFVYESKYKGGLGKVIGEFDIVENHEFPIGSISFEDCMQSDLVKQGVVAYGFLKEYANGAEFIYANIIKNAKRYDEPKELWEFSYPCTGKKCSKCQYEVREVLPFGEIGVCCGRYNITRPPQSWCNVEV